MTSRIFFNSSGQTVEQTLPSSPFKILVNNTNRLIIFMLLFINSKLTCALARLCWGLGLLLEREREAFRKATVEPVLQLKDDLRFRLGEAQSQDLTANQSDWEEVKQQVSE